MSKLMDGLLTGNSYTANGALTHQSSLDACLDFFFLAGASRNVSEKDILSVFLKAFGEDKDIALKILFWARDSRGGAGERRLFRVVWKYLVENKKEVVAKLASYVSEYGRFDDLFNDAENKGYLIPAEVLEVIKKGIEVKNGLLAKWLPRKGIVAKQIQKYLKLSPKEYRKTIVSLSKTVEQTMSKNAWEEINFENVPSCAFNQYKKAWKRHLENKYTAFLEGVAKGTKKINAKVLFPYQVLKNLNTDKDLANVQWENLPDYGGKGDILPVIDVSGSMRSSVAWTNVQAIDIAMSVGLYLAERIKGRFNNCFISFSGKPNVHKIAEGTLYDKVLQISESGEDMSTNLQGVFDLILNTAIRDNLSQEDLPKTLIVLSDMEFNSCSSYNSEKINFDLLKEKFEAKWYQLPNLVFWDILGRIENVPATKNDSNVALVSGASPAVVKSILGDEDFSPLWIMLKTVLVERYKNIQL